jgi:tryptophan halogenase
MTFNKVKKLIIFGGGTSGWLTAAYLSRNLQFPCEITLIEDETLGPIGVGEGTQPATARFLHDCGIEPKTWMKPSNAVFKLGVEFVDWTNEKYFVDNDFIENTLIAPNLFTTDYFVGKDKKEFFDWLPAYQLAKENKSPKLAGMDTNYAQTGNRQFGAVHFAAFDIVKTIRGILGNSIKHVNTKIEHVESNDNGITGLIDSNNNRYEADLYLDCSGFSSLLLEKKLGIEFTSITDILPCDRAVALPTQYKDPVNECFPYTRSTAMPSGWRWTIPIFNRTGNGYVYSSKFTTPEEAEAELRKATGEYTAKANHLTMKCGIHNVIAHKNVCAVGLSAGFVEPLEATGITFTTKAVELITQGLNRTNGIWSSPLKAEINRVYDTMFWEIVAFVWIHYRYSTKSDTPFWNNIRNQSEEMIPEKVLNYVRKFIPSPNREFFHHPSSSFHVGHWFSVLKAGGVYDTHHKTVFGDVEKYAEYFIKNQTHRVELVKEMFPNHYEFLKDWYGSE